MADLTLPSGDPYITLDHTCDDTVDTLDDISGWVFGFSTSDTPPRKLMASGAIITVKTNPLQYAFGADPVQTGLGHQLAAGSNLVLTNHRQLRDIRFINQTNGSDAVISVTIFTRNA